MASFREFSNLKFKVTAKRMALKILRASSSIFDFVSPTTRIIWLSMSFLAPSKSTKLP